MNETSNQLIARKSVFAWIVVQASVLLPVPLGS